MSAPRTQAEEQLALEIAEVRRELAIRLRVYPKWVLDGRMKLDMSERSIKAMQSVHDRLVRLQSNPDLRHERIADTSLSDADLKDERSILVVLKPAFDNLIVAINRLHQDGGGSHATRGRLEEMARQLADIAPNWREWQDEIDEAARQK